MILRVLAAGSPATMDDRAGNGRDDEPGYSETEAFRRCLSARQGLELGLIGFHLGGDDRLAQAVGLIEANVRLALTANALRLSRSPPTPP